MKLTQRTRAEINIAPPDFGITPNLSKLPERVSVSITDEPDTFGMSIEPEKRGRGGADKDGFSFEASFNGEDLLYRDFRIAGIDVSLPVRGAFTSGALLGFDFEDVFIPARKLLKVLRTPSDRDDAKLFDKLLKRGDVIELDRGDQTVDAGRGDDTISGGRGDDDLIGGRGNDVVDGDGGEDRLDLGGGRDVGRGGDGDDTISGGNGGDTIDGGAGDDVIDAGRGPDEVTGDAGNDRIDAGGGNDTVDGGEGDDDVTGGRGNDRLTGGAGADDFIYAEAGQGFDVIADFSSVDDLVLIDRDVVAGFEDLTVLTRDGSGAVRFAGTAITFEGRTEAEIDADWFEFADL